jgi:oligoendopeptidase F
MPSEKIRFSSQEPDPEQEKRRNRMPSDRAEQATGAEEVLWDLSDLYLGPEDPSVERDLESVEEMALSFRERYLGKVASLDAPALKCAMEEYEAILEKMAKVESFSHLWFVTDTLDPSRGKFLQKVREKEALVRSNVLFFELEWVGIEDGRAQELLRDPVLSHWGHYLRAARRYKPHLLSEPEERILAEKSVTGASAWVRLFEETINDIPFELHGKRVTEEDLLSLLYSPERELRTKAAQALTQGLKSRIRTLTFTFNMVASDKAIEDRLRKYPHWLSARNLANEIEDEMVETLVEAVVSRYDLPRRYYELKKRLLGLDTLYDYDRYAPIFPQEKILPWQRAQGQILEAFSHFSKDMAEIASLFFERRWIDAAVRQGKRSGAFSHPCVPSVHPYIMVNYTGKLRDAMTLAHELGHGVHQFLARKQGFLNSQTPLTLAETASVFGEILAFERLASQLSDKRELLALLCSKIEDTLATVFRQIAMNRFEDACHRKRREGGELTTEEISHIWLETQKAMFQGSVTLTEDYSLWWSYIPHFLHTPGYVYAYAFGELLVLALFSLYREKGDEFVEGYLEMLSMGGAASPKEIVAKAGVDLSDPGLWHRGLEVIEDMIQKAEAMAEGL